MIKNTENKAIKTKSICVFRNHDKILVAEYLDGQYYRPLGGSIEFGENSAAALKREIREELNVDVAHLNYLGVIESIDRVKGELKHEIFFIFDGEFKDALLYEQESLTGYEATSKRNFKVIWKSIDEFENGEARLKPEGLFELLESDMSASSMPLFNHPIINYPSIRE